MLSNTKQDTKQRILEAATQIAHESGPGNLSLDAVAARAGVSKGGLLYHFPSKNKLLEAAVMFYLDTFEKRLSAREQEMGGEADGLARAYLGLFEEERCAGAPPPSGILAALAENPDFFAPIRHHNRLLIERLKEKASDPALALIVLLAIQGMRSTQLLNLAVMTDEEATLVIERLKQLLGEPARP